MSEGLVMTLPGWWGKLPGTGDFSSRRLDRGVRQRLDEWLQLELRAMRARHSHWQSAYLGAPVWHFAAGAGLLDETPWLGVLMPSVDRVGRYFPLVIAQALPVAAAASVAQWWGRATAAALQALAEDQDPEQFEDALEHHFPDATSAAPSSSPARPMRSVWQSAAGAALPLTLDGWPRGAHFDLLFDLGGMPAALEPDA